MSEFGVPFNRVVAFGRELEYVSQTLAQGHVGGNGPFTKECERSLETEASSPWQKSC